MAEIINSFPGHVCYQVVIKVKRFKKTEAKGTGGTGSGSLAGHFGDEMIII